MSAIQPALKNQTLLRELRREIVCEALKSVQIANIKEEGCLYFWALCSSYSTVFDAARFFTLFQSKFCCRFYDARLFRPLHWRLR